LNYCLLLGIIFINIGFFFKLSLAPFHIWLPDIFDGSIKVVVAVFSTLPKIALIFIIYRFYNVLLIKLLIDWQYYTLIFVILSWIIGIMGALRVNKINKLLAYSSINHMGFLILSVLVNNMESFIIYLVLYNSITITIFIILFTLCKYNNDLDLNNINQFIYLYKSNAVLASCFILILFSLAGIPPLAGFFSKYILIMAALQLNWYLIIFIGLLLSVNSCFYYLRLIKLMFFNNNKYWVFFKNIPKVHSYIISYAVLFNITFILYLPIIHEFLIYIESLNIIK
jgi:NADH-quinone oxidoreductase subunit N